MEEKSLGKHSESALAKLNDSVVSLEERIEDLEEQVRELQEILVIYGIATYDVDDEEDEKTRFYS